MKSYYPKTLKRVNGYLRYLLDYFDQVLHQSGGRAESQGSKSVPTAKPAAKPQLSPESFNIRGANAKKQDKKKNPAP